VVIPISMSAETRVALQLLEREAIRVTIATPQLLEKPPAAGLYLITVEAAVAGALSAGLDAWARSAQPQRGLIGVVEGGGGRDRETLLAAGFDDVMATPLSARELCGRIRALDRRVRRPPVVTGRLRFGPLTLDYDSQATWIDGGVIGLTSIEFAVLRELMKARGRPLSRIQLLELAWGDGEIEITERAVDNVIMRLRRKLPSDVVETVRSVGFRIGSRSP